ncbi:hypothetical protein SAM23877_3426 [Streptomyces ambofaciens ATCC 23877]|uniref:Uncharacterized protein n=1 Tax=Streptomyces ambofaciens (strain ATCC 23877 / 3486 / DSM 40053 / JCM 4204 / NBRC 12836 / NRRL B-2516) TaxID=278992 RepID=A0A0K2AU11_STRA7|nr:hypothetical protein SAM23877_3426 [Streptomyces ambofaciens ATCC 23877]
MGFLRFPCAFTERKLCRYAHVAFRSPAAPPSVVLGPGSDRGPMPRRRPGD